MTWPFEETFVINQFYSIQSHHQVYSSKKLHELYSTPAGWPGADDSFIQNRIDDLPKWIRGISSQAFEDFSDILTEFRGNCIVLGITGDIVSCANWRKTSVLSLTLKYRKMWSVQIRFCDFSGLNFNISHRIPTMTKFKLTI